MMKFVMVTGLLFFISCASKAPEKPSPFPGMKGCFLLYNMKTGEFEKEVGEACKVRYPACSSFKVPLAVMAFDSGVLQDERETLKWDGKKKMLPQWNKDHNAESWMKDSVVWFSQRVTPKMGAEKLQDYLDKFEYGNKDISSGLTTAWLNPPNDPRGFLGLNAYEQVEFMKKLWLNDLPASSRAMELARRITYLETSPNGFRLSGKTGSNFYDKKKKIQFGWFISHVSNNQNEYIAVTNISDLNPIETHLFGGQRAKAITIGMLKEAGLW